MRILGIDPSGNFTEGKGTTGLCFKNTEGNTPCYLTDIKAKNFNERTEYWNDIIKEIDKIYVDVIVCEDYFLYNNKTMKASAQSNSILETPRLLGAIEIVCKQRRVKLVFQRASIKTRWTDDILVNMGILERRGKLLYYNGTMTNDHQRDALRHVLHYEKYGGK